MGMLQASPSPKLPVYFEPLHVSLCFTLVCQSVVFATFFSSNLKRSKHKPLLLLHSLNLGNSNPQPLLFKLLKEIQYTL